MLKMKQCTRCKCVKSFDSFFSRVASKDGLQHICKVCDTAARRARKDSDPAKESAIQLAWRTKNSVRKKATDSRIYQENLEKRKRQAAAYYLTNKARLGEVNRRLVEANRESYKETRRVFRLKNIERVTKARKDHYLANKSDYIAAAAHRRAAELQATPAWADLEKIKAIYRMREDLTLSTGVTYHVDHVIPLRSKKVCGLHVHNNLRVITRADNLKKSNELQLEEA